MKTSMSGVKRPTQKTQNLSTTTLTQNQNQNRKLNPKCRKNPNPWVWNRNPVKFNSQNPNNLRLIMNLRPYLLNQFNPWKNPKRRMKNPSYSQTHLKPAQKKLAIIKWSSKTI